MSRIYLDSNIYVYYFNRDPHFFSQADSIFQRLLNPRHELWATAFTLSELLVVPLRAKDESRVEWLNDVFRSSSVHVQPYTLSAAMTFANLRGLHRVKPMDALNLACAATAGVDLFLTNDKTLTRLTVPGSVPWPVSTLRSESRQANPGPFDGNFYLSSPKTQKHIISLDLELA